MSGIPNTDGPIRARTAIVHDWFQGFHGSERLVEALWSGLFDASRRPDILTFHAARELLPKELAEAIVAESRLARLPGVRQRGHHPGRWRYLLPYMPRYFARLPLRGYELVISSAHAFAANVRVDPGALHVCYCHTPIRYVWMPETDAARIGGVKASALDALRGRLRRIDLEASRHPDSYIVNSNAVRERVARFYGRDAVVIPPPVDVDDFSPVGPKDPLRFLWVHRLVSYKRPEVVVEAFRGLPYRLTMVGVGPLEPELRAHLPANVELRGWVARDELRRLFEGASGFVHVGEEDFGISMVEALAAGTPVVALDRGGARDIVRPGVDGILLATADVASLRKAVEETIGSAWDRAALAARARTFARARFLERFRAHLAELGVR